MKKSGNTVLITGGGSGIGLALAELLIQSNNEVIVCGRNTVTLDAAKLRVPGLQIIRADVANPEQRLHLIADLKQRFPRLNVLVNNAGQVNVADLTRPEHVAMLEAEVAVNLIAPVALTSGLLPQILAQQGATIVNVTTGYVFLPSARTAPYSATKTALRVMTRSLRFQLRGRNAQVTEVMPPPVDTAMASHYPGSKMTAEAAARRILIGLIRGDEEIAIGMSRLARLLGRLLPQTAFGLMNRTEMRAGFSPPSPTSTAGV
jgi:uncharacterized oxidoreductase